MDRPSFANSLAEVRHAFRLLREGRFCFYGCGSMVREGARSYSESAPVVLGVCAKCHRPRYSRELDPDAPPKAAR